MPLIHELASATSADDVTLEIDGIEVGDMSSEEPSELYKLDAFVRCKDCATFEFA